MAFLPTAQGLTPAQAALKRRAIKYQFGPKSTQLQYYNGAQAAQPFTPFRPTTPDQLPLGTYDPGLDATLRAGQRGFSYLQEDVGKQGGRLSDDYQRGVAQTREDHQLATAELARRYGALAVTQNQAARAAGAARGGALVQAFAKRTANQAHDQAPLDLAEGRQLSELGLGYQRSTEDLGSQLSRAGSELGFLGSDTGIAKLQQAKQSGYVFPTAPAGEVSTPGGQTYRTFKGKATGKTYYVLPDGRVTQKKPR